MQRERLDRHKINTETSAQVLRYVLDRTGLSQAQLAEELEVSESFISRALNGERNLTIDHIEFIESRFNMPMGAMFLAISKPGTDPKYERLRQLAKELLLQGDRVIAAVKSAEKRKQSSPGSLPKRASA